MVTERFAESRKEYMKFGGCIFELNTVPTELLSLLIKKSLLVSRALTDFCWSL